MQSRCFLCAIMKEGGGQRGRGGERRLRYRFRQRENEMEEGAWGRFGGGDGSSFVLRLSVYETSSYRLK